MRSFLVVGLVVALAAAACSTALSQNTKAVDDVNAALDSLQTALAAGDVEAAGKLISDSAFALTVGMGEQPMVVAKKDFLEYLRTQAAGMAGLTFADREIGVHLSVALVKATIKVGDAAIHANMALLRAGTTWKLVTMLVSDQAPVTDDQAVTDPVLQIANSLPEVFVAGKLDKLEAALNDPLVATVAVIPTGELYVSNSKTQLLGQLRGVIYMAGADVSRLEDPKVTVYGNVATVEGTWVMRIGTEGDWRLPFVIHLAKIGGGWKFVAGAGGPEEK